MIVLSEGDFRMKKALCASLAILMILLSGCGTRSQGPAAGKSASSVSHLVKGIEQMVNSKEYQTIEAKLEDGRPWAPLAVTDGGQIYGYVTSKDKTFSQILCYDINTNKIESLYMTEKGFEPYQLSECGDFLLWCESVSPHPSGSSKIVLYNKKTKTTKALSLSRDDPNHIALGKNAALWSETDPDRQHWQIDQYDLHTGKTSVLAEDADQPAVGDHFIAWLGRKSSKNGAVYVKNLNTDQIEKITDEDYPTGLAACGDKLIYCGYPTQEDFEGKMPHNSELVLYQNGRKKTLETSAKLSYESPSICASCVSWNDNTATRIYSFLDDKIITLQNQSGTSLSCDSYLIWTVADPTETKEQAIKDGMVSVKINILKIPQ